MENPYPNRSVEQQLQAILRADADFVELVRSDRILSVPLKRATDTDPLVQANAPTPQCFRDDGTGWLWPSCSISGIGVATGGDVRQSRYMQMMYTIAMYAGPVNQHEGVDLNADAMLWKIRFGVVEALKGQKVWYPGGHGSWVKIVNDLSSPVPVPEFPGAGKVMLERVRVLGVARRD